MIGPSADGNGWVNINNKCAGCGTRMPLPESHGKHCPDCGLRVLTWEEMRPVPRAELPKPATCCPKCGVKGSGRFCTECGTRMTE